MCTPAVVPIYAKRACRAAKFGTTRGALLLIASFFLALIPWSLDCVLAETPELGTPFTVKALQSQCYAETPSPGEYPEADLNFIEYLANSAGVGNTGNVIASSSIVTTSIGVIAVSTGVNLVKAVGVQNGAHLSTCLDSLVDAADYPDYSTLTAQQQAAWVSKENYDAAKFNSLLNAFGLGDAAQRYKQGFTGSGGGHGFSFTEQEQNKVQRLGRIANRWINGAGNTVEDVKSFFNNKQAIETWLPQASEYLTFTKGEQTDWPSDLPSTINAAYSNSATIVYKYTGNQYDQYYGVQTNSETLMFLLVRPGDNGHMYGGNMQFVTCSKTSYQYRTQLAKNTYSGWSNAVSSSLNGKSFYYSYNYGGNSIDEYTCNVPLNVSSVAPITQSAKMRNLVYCLLYGDEPSGGGSAEAEEVEDYPEEPAQNQNTWIPAIGIVPQISWPQLTTPNIPNPSESPYNPDFETDTPEWNNEATTNLLHLSDIKFDKLFPFCLLFDISLLFNKVQSTIADDGNSYNVLDVPFDYGVDDEDMTVNLTWLHDLALMIRPFVQILLAALLLFVTIWFWKGILAG